MTDYQIILLPAQGYWDWVQVCRDYVKTFGANLTHDPDTAGRYLNPNQIVTVVIPPEGYPAIGDISAWFQKQYMGVRMDLIPVDTPDALAQILAGRIASHERLGRSQQPFSLAWPTDYAVVTQPFGAHPEIYSQMGVPGHEGLDIRAPMNANVYACADGTVFQVRENPQGHNYGKHIRIQHRDGYLTVYAHLMEIKVKAGDGVTTGQLIGKADSTGNSKGSHLHITLKKEGATANGLTRYPNDIIDPTPFMIWPAPRPTSGGALPTGCLVGVNARPDGSFAQGDLDVLQRARVEAVKLPQNVTIEDLDRLWKISPNLWVMVDLKGGLCENAVAPAEYVQMIEADIRRFMEKGIVYYQVAQEPNLYSEGWGTSWSSGTDFTIWFLEVYNRLHGLFPNIKLGFPGLSMGEQVEGLRQDGWVFLEETEAAAQAADWIGVNAYWSSREEMSLPQKGRMIDLFRQRYPTHELLVSEFANVNPQTSLATKGEEYATFYQQLRGQAGVKAAFANILSSARGFDQQAWRSEDGKLTDIALSVGKRPF